MVRPTPERILRLSLSYGVLAAVSLLFLTPLIWMISSSLKPTPEFAEGHFFPHEPTIEAYPRLLRAGEEETAQMAEVPADEPQKPAFDFLLYARNTLIIAGLSLIGMLISSSIAAYGFARLDFPGRNVLFAICLATMMIPFPVLMVPQYMLFKYLGWIGTFLPLWVPAWFASAFNVFLLRQFFMGIPRELEESARIDGCSRWGCFVRIMLPLSKPALAVVALFHFLFVWNDLVGPIIYLNHQDQFTLALGLQFLQSRAGNTPWNELMAASTLVVVPVLVLFVFAQRTFIRGIATTGLKG